LHRQENATVNRLLHLMILMAATGLSAVGNAEPAVIAATVTSYPVAVPNPETKVEPKTGLVFVHLPGGTFHYGCEPKDKKCGSDEEPGKSAMVKAFWIGKTDVTVAAYARCVSAGACTVPNSAGMSACLWNVRGKESHPINCVNWSQSVAFCKWIGGRLPTAKEWEYAAKGGESRIYPWGNDAPNENRALFWKSYPSEGPAPAESYIGGASKYGLLNMAGNVWQWTGSNYDATHKELRGGSWVDHEQALRASNRDGDDYDLSEGYDEIGFRCGL
jgi:formylglycine-generating enzyme required for sulfatase activity